VTRAAALLLAALVLAGAQGTLRAQEIPADEVLPAPSGFEVDELPVEPPAAIAEEPVPPPSGRGIGSWYGPRFHGRRTASGERFDMHALTAAHPTLPFGTLVRVENADDGRSIDVRINDRGPHIKQRVIDLSRAAARALGLLDAGTGLKEVILRVIKSPAP
jgi:rare lipoprotein A